MLSFIFLLYLYTLLRGLLFYKRKISRGYKKSKFSFNSIVPRLFLTIQKTGKVFDTLSVGLSKVYISDEDYLSPNSVNTHFFERTEGCATFSNPVFLARF